MSQVFMLLSGNCIYKGDVYLTILSDNFLGENEHQNFPVSQ